MKKIALLLSLLLIISGCGKKNELNMPGLTDVNATAIALSASGEVIDFVHIKPGSGIDWIEFHAPKNGNEIQVVAIGPSVHPEMPSGMVVSSKLAEGFMGKVTVKIENDMIISIGGNSISFGNPLDIQDLEKIKTQLGKARERSEYTTIIKTNKYLAELSEDGDGNLVPSNITAEQKIFLSDVLQALRESDMQKLSAYVHKDSADTSGINTVKDFLKLVSKKKIVRYQFMRFDAGHPDNKHVLNDMNGGSYRHSLPVEWVFTVYFSDSSVDFEKSADLLIGSDNGILKFPTKYAD
jgi:hypothetical protein